MRATCAVPLAETREVLALTKTIDGAVVSILSRLARHNIADDLVRDLAEIASASEYIRGVAEQALPKADEKVNGARAETAVTS